MFSVQKVTPVQLEIPIMPELPEVETMVRGIRNDVEDHFIDRIRLLPSPCKPISISPSIRTIQRKVKESRICNVYRIGKRIVIKLENEWSFVIEPRMTGLMLLDNPPSRKHLRVEWVLQRHSKSHVLWFWDRRGLGTMRLMHEEEIEAKLTPPHFGKDALLFTAEDWMEFCQRTGRSIKPALLEQKWIAGIGNLYASEILHEARISPFSKTNELDTEEQTRLAAATQSVLERAIAYEGSTLSDGTYRNAVAKSGRYQNEHRVYAREGKSCPSCGTGIIQRVTQNQRSSFYCPNCQSED